LAFVGILDYFSPEVYHLDMREKLHLKDRLYYSDLYDKHTVDLCRRIEKSWSTNDTSLPKYKGKVIGKERQKHLKSSLGKFEMYFQTGERYINKDKTIQEWMDRDQELDRIYESAEPPENVRCLTCRNRLNPIFKELIDKRVLFMFECPNKCLPRRAFYSDGEEWRSKADMCPQCGNNLSIDMK
jgi:hypothetical protein